MSRNKILLISAVAAALLLSLVNGCGASPGISGGDGAELEAARELIDNLEEELSDSQGKVDDLMQQIKEVVAESELVGKTDADTARNVVEQYHETHTYSMTDLFVCADMAMDVWNMLQAQGIDAVIKIGDVEKAVLEMQDANHAWVVAEVGPGELLALETTNGQAVARSENPLYYAGWAFDSPAEYKKFEELKYEHNIRVDEYNSMIEEAEDVYQSYQAAFSEYQELVDEFNSTYGGMVSEESLPLYDEMNNQRAAKAELEGRYNQLQELITEQQQELEKIVPQMESLAQ